MAFDTLLDKVRYQKNRFILWIPACPPDAAAMQYEEILNEYFGTDILPAKTFDLVLLGMGDDGHTLSLFPGTPVIHEEKFWVTSFYLKAQDMYRITLTKNIVNHADHIVFMISGKDKAHALYEVIGRRKKSGPLPFTGDHTHTGRIAFFRR